VGKGMTDKSKEEPIKTPLCKQAYPTDSSIPYAYTDQPKITCITCGQENVPDWDGNGHCITCARDLVLGGKPSADGEELKPRLRGILAQISGGAYQAGADYKVYTSDEKYIDQIVAAINSLYISRAEVVEAIGDGELATETEYGIAEIIKIGHRDELRVQIRKELGL
jgi:hypothetical protein